MLYTDMTKKAMRLCFEAHKNQKDRAGLPYIFHPFHLAEQMTDEAAAVTALLHDVVEDTCYTLKDLREMGFPPEALGALKLLTHDKKVPYMEYIVKLRKNPIARTVKAADLAHNSDLTRLDKITENDRKRLLKYRIARAILQDDPYDGVRLYYRKAIPLDSEPDGLMNLSVFYSVDEKGNPKVKMYSFDIEQANAPRYNFSPETAEKLNELLDKTVSLPEAAAYYLMKHSPSSLIDLMDANGLQYTPFPFD